MSGPEFLGARGPIGLAHRGGAAESVENSPSAFQRALDLGYRYIETDVRPTSDGHAMVFHDATLDRVTDAVGEVRARTRAEMREVRLPNGESPITLAEALARWPHALFNVDVKDDAVVVPFLREVGSADAWHRVCAAAFSTPRLRRLRRLAGPRLATSTGPTEVARLVLGAPTPPVSAAQVPPTQSGFPLVTRMFVERAHRRGIAVHVWTINDAPQMRGLLDLGVDGIVTDRPTVLREVLMERGQW